MNEIKIYLKPSGSTAELYKDFNLYQESYRNVQITIYVPTVLLYKNADNTFFNTVQTGAILTATTGAKVPTKGFNAAFVKTVKIDNVEYAEYTQIMPKEYTLYAGTQIIVCNVVSVDNTDASAPKIISVTTSQRALLVVQESAYLSETEPLDPDDAQVIEGLINDLQEQLNNGTFAARAIYPWSDSYTYGLNELTFYPDKGEYGVFIKSLVADNKAEPYINGVLNGESWQEVADFNIINELYTVRGDVAKLAQEAAESAEAAEQTVLNGKNDIQNIISDGQENIEQIISAGKESVEATAFRSAQSADEAAKSAQSAEGSKTTAEEANQMAQSWAERAREYAQFGIKINTDYQSVDELPTEGNPQFIYLIPNGSTGNNSYDEYMWVTDKNAYEKIGTTEIDLTAYVPKSGAVMTGTLAMPKLKVDKIARNEADSIYIEPKVTMHSQTTFENQINVGINGSDCYLYNDKDGNYNHSGDGQLASHLVIRADGGVTVRGSETAEETIDFNVLGELKEKGQRVYSPNNHDETKVSKSGDKMTGPLNLEGNTWNLAGYDAYFGSNNQRGAFCIKGATGATTLCMSQQNNDNNRAKITFDGTNVIINKAIYENSQRVYSPHNKPTAATVGITYNPSSNGNLTIRGTNGSNNLEFIWGFVTVANGTHTINFRTPFPNGVLNIQYSRGTGTYDWDKSIITNMTRTGFTIRNDANPFVCRYFAIGY